ncbi:putative phosphatidylinositol-4-phosphate 5-kinase-like protein [Trypanosoma conorhini]|uniref:Putative phosphatidylinositol-4-phosphate 5-kinase-like protein n=1 Tax=Trypanosoma conorhini TaxID=83891 RepID=A0A3R7LL28_9TRYP|nr:putative phosphatidylinositol-4-phosphate 5-kinase-like protein [Trypanosoma conorhini]RNF16518.1 putative phosphatidylinositol-4-phosphate 5-kinase-like protein [Trypanosoma conorhini]
MPHGGGAMVVTRACLGEDPALSPGRTPALGNDDAAEVELPDGSKYVGSVRRGSPSGHGTYYYAATGDRYEGEWKGGVKHGHGTYTYASGDRYVGSWHMGKKHYRGTYTFANGDEYCGFWRDDAIEGYGVLTIRSSGNRYEGHWRESYRHGQGVFYHSNGDVYDGNWVRGNEEGDGIFIQNNGNVYCGEWKAGEMHGKGILRDQHILFAVEYADGHLVSQMPIAAGKKLGPEWSNAYEQYESYMGKYLRYSDRETLEKDELRRALENVKVECALWRKRYEDLCHTFSTATRRLPDIVSDEKKQLALPSISQSPKVAVGRRRDVGADDFMQIYSPMRAPRNGAGGARATQATRHGGKKVASPLQTRPDFDGVRRPGRHAHSWDRKDGPTRGELRRELESLRQHNAELVQQLNAPETQRVDVAVGAEQPGGGSPAPPAGKVEAGTQSAGSPALGREAAGEAPAPGGQAERLEAAPAETAVEDGQCTAEPPEPGEAERLGKKLEEVSRKNAELYLRCDALEKELREQRDRYRKLVRERSSAGDGALPSICPEEVERLESELENAEEALRTQTVELNSRNGRCMELEEALLKMGKQKTADPHILRSLNEKMDLMRTLQESNAELGRVLEENKMELEVTLAASKITEEQVHSIEGTASCLREELKRVGRELKRVQHRSKKISADREAVAAKLHDATAKLAGAECALKTLQGRWTIVLRVRGCEKGPSPPSIRIHAEDSSQVVLSEKGGMQTFKFDICVDETMTSLNAMFCEVCRNIVTVTLGFHVAYVTLGAIYTGKTTMFDNFVPRVVHALCDHSHRFSVDKYAVTYKVAAVRIGVAGAVDCATDSAVAEVQRDAYGLSVPAGVTFVEATDVDLLSTVERLRQEQLGGRRSHIWIQIRCVIAHRVRQTFTVGRVTLVDLCGPGPLLKQPEDVESARFANRSFGHILAVLESLQDAQGGVVPYARSLETTLLSDVFGGNALTTILGTVSSAEDDVGESEHTLRALTMASKAVNAPLLPCFVSSDELRLRELVETAISAEKALPSLWEVDGLREM